MGGGGVESHRHDSNFSGCAHGTFMAVVHIRLPTALIEGGG